MSGIFNLNLRDFINGFIMAVGGAVLTFLQQFISNGALGAVNWKLVGGVALAASITYLGKNLGTKQDGTTLGIPATKLKG